MRIGKQSTSTEWFFNIFRTRCSFHSEWICVFPKGPCVLLKRCWFLCLKMKSNRFPWVPLMAPDEIHCNRVTFCSELLRQTSLFLFFPPGQMDSSLTPDSGPVLDWSTGKSTVISWEIWESPKCPAYHE